MKIEAIPFVQHRHFGRIACVASLFLVAFASTASAFSTNYNSLSFALFGAARYERNPLCPDGYMIDEIGFGAPNYCTIAVTVPNTGTYNVHFMGETEYPRAMFLASGSESGPQSSLSGTIYTGTNFKIPVNYDIGTIQLNSGVNTLVFFNTATTGKFDRCPYISTVIVSQ